MDSAIGWLFDVTIEQNAATLWIKTTEGTIFRLIDKFRSSMPNKGRHRTLSDLVSAAKDKSRVAK